jgi:hypothetical protein
VQLIRLFTLLLVGVCVIIKPDAIVLTSWLRKSGELFQQPSYDKATMRLWRGLGIGITILAIFFLLKEFKVL